MGALFGAFSSGILPVAWDSNPTETSADCGTLRDAAHWNGHFRWIENGPPSKPAVCKYLRFLYVCAFAPQRDRKGSAKLTI